jgi:hypothetical protein
MKKISLLRSHGTAKAPLLTSEGRVVTMLAPFYPTVDAPRPVTRGDCKDGPRPCPWVSCRHHLYLDVAANGTSITFNFPDKEVDELTETCALDVADRGGVSQEVIAEMYGMTHQGVDDIEQRAKSRLRGRERLKEIAAQAGRDGRRFRLPVVDEDLDLEGRPEPEETDDD